ncbi:tyrosine-type recombinase/integrase [Entomomonas sp. E2T0]|uniref:tyrosine-type recombinase/integrase n=1 Tax=Entomomonas sp. E2T0 TaxID=2930213 RepID=UPI002228382B|nr:tyrosine-type recombinase/integrase [Entomomonas sp. E2T0]UYZ83173.1 tyrosine-type recombinase/integrase [Entomomonas sp. E2T0]
MRPKSPENRELPVRMIKRVRTLKNGKKLTYYFYNAKGTTSKQKEIPLGPDLDEAKIKWAEFEQTKEPLILKNRNKLGYLFDRYEREIVPTKAPRTQKDNLAELKQLRKAFEDAPTNAVKPHHIAQYRDARTAKTRANREMALLSHIYKYAIEWGIAKENPVAGVRKNKEKSRSYYADDEVFYSVYKYADQALKDMMMVAYLTGQRPADVLSIRMANITNEHLLIGQNKTGHKLRIRLINDDGPTGLGMLINNIISRKQEGGPYLISVNGKGITYSMLRNRFENARIDAMNEALSNKDQDLADRIKQFQFRDTRSKAASDMNDISAASKLLGHSKEKITRDVYIRIGQEVDPLER